MDNSKKHQGNIQNCEQLTGCNTHNPLPPGKVSKETGEDFAKFFSNKKPQYENISQASHNTILKKQIHQTCKF